MRGWTEVIAQWQDTRLCTPESPRFNLLHFAVRQEQEQGMSTSPATNMKQAANWKGGRIKFQMETVLRAPYTRIDLGTKEAALAQHKRRTCNCYKNLYRIYGKAGF